MKIETLIYLYLAICFCMILFNVVWAILFEKSNIKLSNRNNNIEKLVKIQIEFLNQGKTDDYSLDLEQKHLEKLKKQLARIGNLLAFDEVITKLSKSSPKLVEIYLDSIYPVFEYLITVYRRKDDTLVSYFLFIMQKYKILYDKPRGILHSSVQNLIRTPSIYCRENAMLLSYSSGDALFVIDSLFTLDESGFHHNNKLITDGLITFTGNARMLDKLLWEKFESFSVEMQLCILNYFRFSSDRHKDKILEILKDSKRDHELRFSSIRYFGKYPDQRAYQTLLIMAAVQRSTRWEYAAIASTALAAYPSDLTKRILMENLSSSNWYIRYNASSSLEALGFNYLDLIDIFEGNDRYAKEMLQYRMDQRYNQQEDFTDE